MKMRILYFHQYFSTPEGSSGMRSFEFAKALVAKGHCVTMICGRYDGSKTGLEQIPFSFGQRKGIIEGIIVVELFLPYSNSLSFLQRTKLFFQYAIRSVAIVLFGKYDIVFATTTPLTAGIPGIIAKWIRRKPFVFEVRDLWPELPKAMGVIKNPLILSLMSILEWTTYHSSDSLIGLSPGIVEGIVKKGIPQSRVSLIPNGCDSEIFKPVMTKNRTFAGINDSDFVAIFTGTHGVANGLSAVLDAAKVLKSRSRNDIKLLMVGSGKVKPLLQKRALEEGLDNCIFLNPVPKTQIAEITGNCDIGMMVLANVPAFYYGTSPNKFFDYISCGLPILNNYPGWLAEMIKEHNCGIAVTPDKPELFANALIQFADNPKETEIMGKNSLSLATKFNRSCLAENFTTIIENTVNIRR